MEANRRRARLRGEERHSREETDFSGGVMLVGLGLLFFTGWWWPGIMLVIAATMVARALSTSDPEIRRRNLSSALVIALIPFALTMWRWSWRLWFVGWPLMLIVAGAAMIWRAARPKLPPTWRDSLDEVLSEPEPLPTRSREPASDRPSVAREAEEETAFDRLSTIYDPERDRPGPSPAPAENRPPAPADQEAPSLPPPEERIQIDINSIFGEGERRLDRARRGER